MEQLVLSEQEIINAVCIYVARKKQVNPQDVLVELFYDDDYGFSAEAYVNDRKQVLVMSNIIEAIRILLEEYLNRDPYAGIKLVLDDNEGIIAYIK